MTRTKLDQSSLEKYREVLPGFDLLGEIGRGGMGVVLLAIQKDLGRQVAVKLLTGQDLNDRDRQRLKREAGIGASLSHPNLVKVLSASLTTNVPYLVLEFVDGPDLAECLRTGIEVEPLPLARGVADALAYLHGQGMLHRDIKPSNVLVAAGGRCSRISAWCGPPPWRRPRSRGPEA